MKLLFDQNLSPRLPRLLADIYAESIHVREVGLRDAGDLAIWQYAKAQGYAIVSKDSDFQQRSLLHGAPPHWWGFFFKRLNPGIQYPTAALLAPRGSLDPKRTPVFSSIMIPSASPM